MCPMHTCWAVHIVKWSGQSSAIRFVCISCLQLHASFDSLDICPNQKSIAAIDVQCRLPLPTLTLDYWIRFEANSNHWSSLYEFEIVARSDHSDEEGTTSDSKTQPDRRLLHKERREKRIDKSVHISKQVVNFSLWSPPLACSCTIDKLNLWLSEWMNDDSAFIKLQHRIFKHGEREAFTNLFKCARPIFVAFEIGTCIGDPCCCGGCCCCLILVDLNVKSLGSPNNKSIRFKSI